MWVFRYVNDHFKPLNAQLKISNDHYVRTTSDHHKKLAQRVWELAEQAGDIYIDMYEGWYNIKEEAYVTDQDAMDANYKAAAHTDRTLEFNPDCTRRMMLGTPCRSARRSLTSSA